MKTIRIKNADPSDFADIQAIVNNYGFGVLADDGGDWVAVNPDPIKGTDMADLEQELLDDVSRNLDVSFS